MSEPSTHIEIDIPSYEHALASRIVESEAISFEQFVLECIRERLQRPNAVTEETFRKTDAGEELNHYSDSKALFSKLGI